MISINTERKVQYLFSQALYLIKLILYFIFWSLEFFQDSIVASFRQRREVII